MNIALRDPDAILLHIRERISDNALYYILLDEVQLIPEFEDVLNSLLHVHNADVYVTRCFSGGKIHPVQYQGQEIHQHLV